MRFRFQYALPAAGIAALLSITAGADDSEELLQRVKEHMSEHLAQLPNFVCHETVDRLVRTRNAMRHVDTVEFEVAFLGDQELFARPGSDRFGEQPVEKLAPGGTIGNVMLGSSIDVLFSKNVADFKFGGACKKDGRKAMRFDIEVPI